MAESDIRLQTSDCIDFRSKRAETGLDRPLRRLQPPRLGDRSDSNRPAVHARRRSRDRRLHRRARSRSDACRASCSRSSACWRSSGPRRRPTSARFDPRRDGPAFAGIVHRWTREADIVAMLWLLRQMIDRAGSVEGFFLEGYDAGADDIADALDSFSTRALALDLKAAYGRVPEAPRRLLLLSAALGRLGLQAAEPVSPLDGPPRRARSRRVEAGVAGEADRAARHARDPRRPLPAADRLHEPGVADGARHHGVAADARSGRSR